MQTGDQRWLVDDPAVAVDDLGELAQRLHGIAGAGLGDGLLGAFDGLRRTGAAELLELLLEVQPGVPQVQVAHLGEPRHRQAVGLGGTQHDPAPLVGVVSVGPSGDLQTGDQPFDIPLPGPRGGLVEVVDVEDQPALGRAEHPEVGQVGIPAGLHPQAGIRRLGKVRGHDQRRTPEEREGRDEHPAVADRHQFRHPGRGLRFQQRHRVRPVGGGLEHGMAGTGGAGAGGLASRPALVRRGVGHVLRLSDRTCPGDLTRPRAPTSAKARCWATDGSR